MALIQVSNPGQIGSIAQLWLYVDEVDGNDTWDGESKTKGPAKAGPKKTIEAARTDLNTAVTVVSSGGGVWELHPRLCWTNENQSPYALCSQWAVYLFATRVS